jgi:aldose sugar dehydrogenase
MSHGAGRRRAGTARVPAAALAALVLGACAGRVGAQGATPALTDANLTVRTALTGLTQPTGFAFLAPNDLFVIEKSTGRVRHFLNGVDRGTVLDLAVNSASERGLLGIVLDPDFAHNHLVYLYWTGRAPVPANPTFPSEFESPDIPETGADTTDVLAVPLLGNRVDRFFWNGSRLEWERNLIKLRAFQNDGAPIPPNQGPGRPGTGPPRRR